MKHTPRSVVALFIVLLAAMAFWITSCKKDDVTGPDSGSGGSTLVRGIVTQAGTTGNPPLADATVRRGTDTTVTTGSDGSFTIPVASGTDVTLTVTKTGYSFNEVVVNVAGGSTKILAVSLLAEGEKKTFAVTSGDSVAHGSYKLTVPPNFVTATGNVTVSVTGLDPTTNEIRALPRGLEAVDAGGVTRYLQPVSFAEYVARDASGNVVEVNQSAGQGANIELPIPASLRGQPGYRNGDPIECYLYDAATGKWKTPVPGIVGPSSIDGEPAIKATIFHLSWYGGAPALNERACIKGYVRNATGTPVSGADVEAFAGSSTTTNSAGFYQVDAAPNSNVRVVASVIEGTTIRTGEVLVFTGGIGDTCKTAPDITLGAAQPGSFHVQAALLKVVSSSSTFDLASVDIDLTSPSGSVGWESAVVNIGYGSQTTAIPHSSGGSYSAFSPDLSLTPGESYFITIDFDNNGTIDANGQIQMVGNTVITSPAASATVPQSFTATWTDDASSSPGYNADYFVILSGDSASRVFLTKQRTKVIGDGSVDSSIYGSPQYNDPLPAGSYTMQLWGLNGPAGFMTLGNLQPNINGQNVEGYFYAYSLAEPVDFTSTGLSESIKRIAARKQKLELAVKEHYKRFPQEIKSRVKYGQR